MSKKTLAVSAIAIGLIGLLNSFNACRGPIKGGRDSALSLCASERTSSLFHHGDGSDADPYVICSSEQFRILAEDPRLFNKSFLLGDDLDLSDLPGFNGIGSYNRSDTSTAVPFTGRFDGGGHSVRNLLVRKDVVLTESGGFFNYLHSASVSNLTIENGLVYSNQLAGLLVGMSVNSRISNVVVSGQVLPTSDSAPIPIAGAGAIAGALDTQDGEAWLENSQGSAVLRNADLVGGLVGRVVTSGVNDRVTISNSRASGNIQGLNGGNTFGGLVSYIRMEKPQARVEIQNCRTATQIDVIGSFGSWIGGITGSVIIQDPSSGSRFLLTQTSSSSKVTTPANYNSRGQVGGLLGNIAVGGADAEVELSRSFSTSQIQITNPDPFRQNGSGQYDNFNLDLGGIVGHIYVGGISTDSRVKLSNVFYNGSITVSNVQRVGGLVGSAHLELAGQSLTLENSYAKIEKTTTVESFVHAIIGTANGSGSYSYRNLYWFSNSINTSNPGSSPSMVRLFLNNVNNQSSYVGFDFDNIWKVNGIFSSPELR